MRRAAGYRSVRRDLSVALLALGLMTPGIAGAQAQDEEKAKKADVESSGSSESSDEDTKEKSSEQVDEIELGKKPQSKPKTKTEEEIIVTGSRLKTDYDGLGPVTTLDAEDLDRSGEFNISDLLKERPSIDFGGTNRFDTNGGRGRNTIGLRGLGSGRTLILVNGRRTVQSSNGAFDSVDFSAFNAGFFEGVDILRDGVSTIYGADAVAGVINLRLRNTFDGLRLRVAGGGAEEKDSNDGEVTLLWGKNFDRGNFTIGATQLGFEPLRITDRARSRSPILEARRTANGVQFDRDLVSFPQGIAVNLLASGRNPLTFLSLNNDANGNEFRPVPRNPNGTLNLDTEQTNINSSFPLSDEGYRSAITSNFTYELSSSTELFSELAYSRRNSKVRFSSTFLGGGGTAKNPGGFQFPVFRSDGPLAQFNSPFLPAGFADASYTAIGLGPGQSDPLDAELDLIDAGFFGVPITLFKDFNELGQRTFDNEVKTWRFVGGLRGSLPGPISDISWEGYVNYGRSDDISRTKNEVNFTNALASIQPAICAQTPGCVLGDFFGANGLVTNTPEAVNFIKYDARDRLVFHLYEVGVEGATSIYKLPAGDLRLSVGASFRQEDGNVHIDGVTLNGDSAGLSRQGTRGRQLVREGFFEAEIPIIEGMIGARELSLNVSGRYTDYSTFGGRYLSRYAVNWAPINDLRFRGVYSTSFRSPSISDLFLGPADSFVSLRDPCDGFPDVIDPSFFAGCARELARATDREFNDDNPFTGFGNVAAQTRANIGGNVQLKEETANSYTIGFVYTPSWMSGMNLSVDMFEIEVENPVVGQSAQFRVNNCVIRNQLSECPATQRDNTGQISFVDIPRTNFGSIRTHGLDFAANVTKTLPFVGPTRFAVEGVYTFDFEIENFVGKGKANGIIGGSGGAIPNMRMFFDLGMQPTEELSMGISVQYIGRSKIIERRVLGLPFTNAPAVMYVDAGITYAITDRVRLSIGGQNLTDKQAPLIVGDNNIANTNTSLYDTIGRRYSAVLTVDF